ncbi:dTDP-4-dehydrorhamnose reductase [Roseibaca ekhonensis]|jgi:dTDP-4-dehydrorhamnose reductase|uniref:dTDP-4-dehydrorhamnose reductase n=1 Tax=Roseinatronobacter ekhonensis TaxID=254356 RepID=A0A3B0MXE0_9RHOB|nr:dTDP-4-dehydrorhamnose reductase [Roseibaca ekhonensis]SUZ33394.1 dTDP-4-dehydrorhamnose reductase [Roseibaca ekhonensis]
MILVFGKTGQVATEIARQAQDAQCVGRDRADLADPEACRDLILDMEPAGIINAAAYTAVDRAEDDEELATRINGDAPAAMAQAAARLGIPLVHISTDYVFDGSGTQPFAPGHATAPLGAYGRSKLLGEQGVSAAGGTTAILRTSWVFSAHGTNFLKTMRRLGGERAELNVVADQIGGPTPARDIAAACLTMLHGLRADPSKAGIYHFAGAPDSSWADFAREIMAQAGLDCTVHDIPTSAYPTPARRPLNSRLDCTTLDRFGLTRPDWRAGVAHVLAELGAQT